MKDMHQFKQGDRFDQFESADSSLVVGGAATLSWTYVCSSWLSCYKDWYFENDGNDGGGGGGPGGPQQPTNP